jgi:hypothetical protein
MAMAQGEVRSLTRHASLAGALAVLSDFFAETKRAKTKKQNRHARHDRERLPVFEKIRTAENDRAHQSDEVGRG